LNDWIWGISSYKVQPGICKALGCLILFYDVYRLSYVGMDFLSRAGPLSRLVYNSENMASPMDAPMSVWQ